MWLARTGIIAGSAISLTYTPILDVYTNAKAAYSVRRLSSTYLGYAMRVRRSSDNTSQDIGFDSSGNLDTTSMLSFVGANDGFVSIWYDQSGNGQNLAQASASLQFKIVASGSLVTLNGKASLLSPTDSRKMTVTFGATLSQPNTIFNIGSNSTPATGVQYLWDGITSTNRNAMYSQNTGSLNAYAGGTLTHTYSQSSSTQRLLYTKYNNTSSLVAINNGAGTSGTLGSQTLTGLSLNSNYSNSNVTLIVYHQEFIIWNADKTTDRTGISDNINTYYSIY